MDERTKQEDQLRQDQEVIRRSRALIAVSDKMIAKAGLG